MQSGYTMKDICIYKAPPASEAQTSGMRAVTDFAHGMIVAMSKAQLCMQVIMKLWRSPIPPGRPIVADICVTHPLAASAVKATARDTGATAKGKDSLIRDKYSRTGTGACRFVPLSHEACGRAGPTAFARLNEIAELAASSGVVSKKIFLENAMCDLSATLCRGITRQVLATVPLRARLNGRPVVAGLPVPTDDLVPVAGGPS